MPIKKTSAKALGLPEHAEIWLLIGFTGSGKTTYVMTLTEGRRRIIVSYQADDEAMQKIKMIEVEDIKNINPKAQQYTLRINVFRPDVSLEMILTEIYTYIKDAVILIDDAKSEIGDKVSKVIERMTVGVRHKRNEIFWMFHNIDHPPKFIYSLASNLMLFKSAMLDPSLLYKVPRGEEVIKAYNWIQSEQAPRYAHAYVCSNPNSPLSHKPFFKVMPKPFKK